MRPKHHLDPDLLANVDPDLLADLNPNLLADPDLLANLDPDLLANVDPNLLADLDPDYSSDVGPNLLPVSAPIAARGKTVSIANTGPVLFLSRRSHVPFRLCPVQTRRCVRKRCGMRIPEVDNSSEPTCKKRQR